VSGMFGEAVNRAKHKSVEWYTPKWIFDALDMAFDLDPASPFDFESFVPASTKYTVFDDGLSKDWFGTVWLNPPYGPDTEFWMNRLIAHGTGIALVFSRTDAAWCQSAMKACTAMLFLSGRIAFIPGEENRHKASRAGAGTVMFAFGDRCAAALTALGAHGVLLYPRELQP
jgi:hypothetical protein